MSGEQNSARDQILEAAVRVLQDEGPAKLTQTRVAKAAGLRQGHLTYYFPKKSDLWIATASRAHDAMERQFSAMLASSDLEDPKQEVRPRLVQLLTELVENNQRTRILLSLTLQAQEDPELMTLCRENVTRSRGFLRIALGTQYPASVVELTLSALWGLGMRDLVSDESTSDCETHTLIEQLFAFLDQVTDGSSE